MQIILPHNVSDAMLTYSNLAEDDYAEWSSATTYARGDYAISTETHTVYRSLLDTNTDNDPDLEQAALADPLVDDPSPVYWQVISATNLWKLFDKKPSNLAVGTDEIVARLVNSTDFVTGVGLVEVDAAEVSIRVRADPDLDEWFLQTGTWSSSGAWSDAVVWPDGGDPNVIYIDTHPMLDDSVVGDWYEYYFAPLAETSEALFLDIPPYIGAEVEITITRTGGFPKCGQIIVGELRDFGTTMAGGTRFSGFDFSFVEQDDFGDLTTVVRAATRLSDFDAFVPSARAAVFDRMMRDLRGGRPALWIGDGDPNKAATNYGFYRNYSLAYQSADYGIFTINVQGIV